ncbi:MAG: tRNA glutamyl-Q(34) synthetase GluQRS [Planctomycetaceae bacterium]|nr:tRNA glutamyl-Q(34) synthetase GluQRS [Planctomycetaceae bacterium]
MRLSFARPVVGRLAPSPTGAQHLGNARTYLIAWLAARAAGGRVILRIEDIDSPRVKAWAVQQAIDDLRWLGLDWDEGPDIGGPNGPYVQTERQEYYRRFFRELSDRNLVYPCTCSRSDIAAASAPHADQEGPVYPGTCRHRSSRDQENLAAGSFSWRFRLTTESDSYFDHGAGQQSRSPAADLGDFVICKADGTPSYQMAVVLDDAAMGVTQVVRGNDLIPSTFRQRALIRAWGLPIPEYLHLPLVIGPDGRRLAKRHGDTRLSILRENSVPPERLIGFLAWSAGLREFPGPATAQSLLDSFEPTKLHSRPFVLHPAHWDWLLAPSGKVAPGWFETPTNGGTTP